MLQRFRREAAVRHFRYLWHSNLEPFPIDERQFIAFKYQEIPRLRSE